MSLKCPFETLGISCNATSAQIKYAYTNLSALCHPAKHAANKDQVNRYLTCYRLYILSSTNFDVFFDFTSTKKFLKPTCTSVIPPHVFFSKKTTVKMPPPLNLNMLGGKQNNNISKMVNYCKLNLLINHSNCE